MKISRKLFFGFAAVIVLSVAVGVMGIIGITRLHQSGLSMYEEQVLGMENLSRAMNYMHQSKTDLMTVAFMSLYDDLRGATYASERFEENAAAFDAALRDAITIQELNALYAPIMAEFRNYYLPNSRAIIALSIENIPGHARMLEVNVLMAGNMETAERMEQLLGALSAAHSTIASHTIQANEQNQAFYFAMQVGFIVAAIALGLVLAMMITRSIVSPVNKIVKAAKGLSDGNMNVNLPPASRDEIGDLTAAFRHMIEVISGMVDDIDKFAYENKVNGDMEYRIDADKYQGSYNKMLVSFNDFTDDFTNGVIGLLNGMGEVNKGNFNTDVPDMPGKKMLIPNTFRAMVGNIQSVTSELSVTISSVVDGDFSHKIDTSKYAGEWGKIMQGLNQISEAIDTPLRIMEIAINEIKEGQFNVPNTAQLIVSKGYNPDTSQYGGGYRVIMDNIIAAMSATDSYIGIITENLEAIASGNLTTKITQDFVGSYVAIKNSLNNISSSLNKTMSEINSASAQVLSGAKQISASSTELANGASTQASSIKELNASVDLINQQTRQNADNATQANALSQTSTDNAREGNNAMQQTLSAMNQIKDSSNNISKIIRTIQDIAFQTNLLALNAAVEAARAGEHGKGFAVVAEEVRNLAARSQSAASETTELIGTSISTVDSGSEIAQSTAETLNTIVDNANKVLDIVSSISTSSQEQAEAISQVVMGLQQISQVVQSNSAVSEEAAAASEELTSQAEVLQQLVAFFKL